MASSLRVDQPARVGGTPARPAMSRPIRSASAIVRVRPPPEWEMTRANSGWARGDASRLMTAEPPADWPAIVTCEGSPPNAAMLSRTHSRPRIMSRRPRLVGASAIQPKPSKPRRYERETVTMPSRLYEAPSYHGLDGDPAKNPPPWIQTSTGSLTDASPGAGVKTLTFSVASPGNEG